MAMNLSDGRMMEPLWSPDIGGGGGWWLLEPEAAETDEAVRTEQ